SVSRMIPQLLRVVKRGVRLLLHRRDGRDNNTAGCIRLCYCLYHLVYVLVCQRLRPLFAACRDLASFEAEPVDASDDKEDEQRKLEDGNIADHIQYRDFGPGGEDQIEGWIGVDAAQTAVPQEVDNHQTAVD